MERRPAKKLLDAVSTVAPGMKPRAQRALIRLGYRIVNGWMNDAQAECMNYGYAALDDRAASALPGADGGDERYGYQLYGRVAGAVPIGGREVLEVGCGRGGGATYVARHFGVARLTGLDFSEKAIAFAREHHIDASLRFVRGDAEELPFADGSFDAVLNVESSHCYPSMPRFSAEAFRVLRPGGHLLFADLRLAKDLDAMRRDLLAPGFEVVEEERITPNVVRALELDSPRRIEFVRRQVPKVLQSYVFNFAASDNSAVYAALRDGELEYLRFALVKPGG